MRLTSVLVLLAAHVACSEYRVRDEQAPVAQPPGEDEDPAGDPPDNWQDCPQGMLGRYYNLPANNPYVLGEDLDFEAVFAEEYLSFERYDTSLEWGESWWPVDDGLSGDPGGYAVQWHGWLRAWDDTQVQLVLGAASDAEVLVDGVRIAGVIDQPAVTPLFYVTELDGGIYPFEIRFAQRGPTSGLRFRVTEGDVSICIPSYSEE